MSRFKNKLTNLFEKVEPQFREETVARYKAWAQSSYESWKTRVLGDEPQPPEGPKYSRQRSEFDHDKRQTMRLPEYTMPISEEVEPIDFYADDAWAKLREQIAKGLYTVNFKKAERDANFEVDGAKLHFIKKQTAKLDNACQHVKHLIVSGELSCNKVVTGFMLVKAGDDQFTLTMNMIVNHRYGRGYTSFYQFPARFTNVILGGEKQKGSISEAWMAENFKPTVTA